ncbi:MAG TPA: LON peptidase substrate-binding domain-containing protein [Thermoanaerobaculia bacterium]|nr:LON peptidase substrate-binding domain-containing protein [Thermoanaerobaculia bacterium]
MSSDGARTRLPLFPLPDLVHFPRTDLKLLVSEARHRRLVRDVLERAEQAERAEREDEDEQHIGIVLLRPDGGEDAEGRPAVFPGGTAARVVDVEHLPDGRSSIHLHGEFRFELERELAPEPYRQALVRPIDEPRLNERDAGIVAVRRDILTSALSLAGDSNGGFPLAAEDLERLGERGVFEELVNGIAAGLDLPTLRKLQLLAESLPERALSLLSILKSRRQVLDLLRPFRHLAAKSDSN